MQHRIRLPLLAPALLCLCPAASQAAAIGSVAELSTLYHNVGGTVTVIDDDTFRVDGFTFDGGGPAVYFYLATGETNAEFVAGLPIMPLLSGTVFDGTQAPLFFDLPTGETFSSYNAISVWCADFQVNFGSGSFLLEGDLNGDSFVGIADLGIILGNWNQFVTPGDLLSGDRDGDGYVGIGDLNYVLGNWNAGTPPSVDQALPEPASLTLLGTFCLLLGYRRH